LVVVTPYKRLSTKRARMSAAVRSTTRPSPTILTPCSVISLRRGDHRIRSIKHGKGCNDHSMKRRRTRTRLQLVPETTGGRLVCGKELLFSWRCSHSRFTRETSSLPCFRYRILPSRHLEHSAQSNLHDQRESLR
jgi:hypothetical protein